MRKETLTAIIIGVIVGLLLGFGIWRANSAFKNRGSIRLTGPTPTPRSEANQLPVSESALNIISPQDMEVTVNEEITISGITTPRAVVAISSNENDQVLRANESGKFEASFKLANDLNQILISAFDQNGKEYKEVRGVVYSTEFKDQKDTGDSENLSLQDRLKVGSTKPTAFVGTVTDKTDTSLQIKNLSGEIQIVAIAEDATFMQSTSTPKAIKYEDVAIGDYVIAMGWEGTKGVLTSQRVLVTNPLSVPKRKIVYGKVASISRRLITLGDTAGLTWTLNMPTKWTGPNTTEVAVGGNLVAVGEQDSEKPENLAVRTISLTPEILETPALSPSPSPKVSPTIKPQSSPTRAL